MKLGAALLALAIPAALPAGAEVLSLDGALPVGLTDGVAVRVAGDPADVPAGALVHAARLPDAGVLADLPPDAVLVVGDCMAVAEGAPLTVAIPSRCDSAALADALAAADGAGPGRTEALRNAGFRIVEPARSGPDEGLVITAMPLEILSVRSAPVIVASPEPAPFRPPADAVPGPGLPQPSVVLGDMAVLMTAGTRTPLGMPHPVREAIRARDAAMFDRLLGQGVFDPDPDRAAAAIQTELARMACYGGRIDGDWGAGSDAALGRYAAAGGGAEPGAGPDMALFRAIARGASVTCAPVQTAAPAPSAAAPRSSAQRAPASQPAPARARAVAPARQQPAPAPAAQGRQINRGLMGTGVFR